MTTGLQARHRSALAQKGFFALEFRPLTIQRTDQTMEAAKMDGGFETCSGRSL